MTIPTDTTEDVLLRSGEVARRLRVSKQTLDALVRRGALEPPLVFGPALRRWRASDVEAAIERARAPKPTTAQ